jgi:hypothetical protein
MIHHNDDDDDDVWDALGNGLLRMRLRGNRFLLA